MVVDYKTDAIPAEAVAARVQYYAPQLRSYATVLAAATTSPDVNPRLLFLNPAGSAVVAAASG